MRHYLLPLLPFILFNSCSSPSTKEVESQPVVNHSHSDYLPLSYKAYEFSGSKVHFITFDDRDYMLDVADQKSGPGSQWPDAKSATLSHEGLAAINAGFFTPEGKPLGIVIDDAEKRGSKNTSSLGAGGYLFDSKKGAYLVRRDRFKEFTNTKELLQAGPFLVEHRHVVANLKASESRPRSFIAHDNKHGWLIGHAESLTMKQLAKMLASIEVPSLDIKSALNLDGGRSCQFYIGSEINGTELQYSSFMNRKVRNFLVLKKKP